MRFLFLFLVLGCGCAQFTPAVPRGYQEAPQSVVALVDDGLPYCSGTMVEGDLENPAGYILTAAHCVEGQEAVEVSTDLSADREYFRSSREVRVLRVDEGVDLALLSLPRGWHGWVRVVGRDPILGEAIVACGHPLGIAYVCNAGRVSSLARQTEEGRWHAFFTVDSGVMPGMSGGPVYDENADLLGVVVFYAGTPGLGGIVSPDAVRHFLAQ